MIPALLVGIDATGRAIVRRARLRQARASPWTLPASRTLGLAATPGPSAPAIEEGGLPAEDLLFPVDPSGGADLDEQLLIDTARPVVDGLLAADNLRRVPGARATACDLIVVAALREPLGGVALLVAERLRRALEESFAGLQVRAEAILLLPEGACDAGERITGALDDLERRLAAGTLPFERVYLFSPCNPNGVRPDDEETIDLCAEFLLVRATSALGDALRRTEHDLRPDEAVGALGLAALEFDARSLHESLAWRYARELVAKGLLVSDLDRDAARADARRAAAASLLRPEDLGSLREELLTAGGSRRLEDEVATGAFLFKEVPISRWPTALATFDVFFRKERFARALARLQENVRSAAERRVDAIRSGVDRIVEARRDPANALEFLAELNETIRALRERLIGVEQVRPAPGGGESPELTAALQGLRASIASEPYPSAIALRVLLLTLTVALPVGLVLARWSPTAGLDPRLRWSAAFLVGALPPLLAAWRTLQTARRTIWERAHGCAALIESRYRAEFHAAVDKGVVSILDRLYFLTLDTPTLAREHPEFAGENEPRAVEAQSHRLKVDLPTALAGEPEGAPRSWRIDAVELAPRPPVYGYRNDPGFRDWLGEGRRLLDSGWLHGWRSMTAADLAGRVREHTAGGVEYVLAITLDDFAAEQLLRDEDADARMTDLYNRLHCDSAPFLQAAGPEPEDASRPMPIMHGGGNSRLLAALNRVGDLGEPLEHADPQEFVLLKLATGVRIDSLQGRSLWRSGGRRVTPPPAGPREARR